MKNNLHRIGAFVGIFVLFGGMIFAQDDAKGVYMDKCSVCHGPDGQAKTAKGRKLKVKSINDTIGGEDEAAMIKMVTEGKGDMPSFSKQLNGDQIKAVVAFFRSKAK